MLALFCLCLFCVLIWEILAGGSSAQLTKLKYGEHTIRKTVLACMSALSPDFDFFLQFFFVTTKIKVCFPTQGTEWRAMGKDQPSICAQPYGMGSPSLSLPWGKQLPRALQYTDMASFLHFFFSNTSSDILTYVPLIYIGSSLFLQAA